MEFYRKCLGGHLILQTLGDSAETGLLPPAMKASVLRACLKNETMVLLGTDMVGDEGLVRGNAVSLLLQSSSDEEIRRIYQNLAKNGIPTHPLASTQDGGLFGGLTDRYGNRWLFHCTK